MDVVNILYRVGISIYINGDTYDGDWENDKKQGNGINNCNK